MRARGLCMLAALVACSEDTVDPITKITAPRVIAITTEPSVLAVDGALELRVTTVDPAGPREADRPVSAVRMRACSPWRLVGDPARDCVDERALPLASAADGRASVTGAELLAAFPPPGGDVDMWAGAEVALPVAVIAEIEVDGAVLTARREIAVVGPGVTRQNPRLAEVRFDGAATTTLAAGRAYDLAVTLDATSLDEDPELPGTSETTTVTFYSPTGELADHALDLADTEPATTTYTTGEPGITWLFVVVTDATAGMSTTALRITVE